MDASWDNPRLMTGTLQYGAILHHGHFFQETLLQVSQVVKQLLITIHHKLKTLSGWFMEGHSQGYMKFSLILSYSAFVAILLTCASLSSCLSVLSHTHYLLHWSCQRALYTHTLIILGSASQSVCA